MSDDTNTQEELAIPPPWWMFWTSKTNTAKALAIFVLLSGQLGVTIDDDLQRNIVDWITITFAVVTSLRAMYLHTKSQRDTRNLANAKIKQAEQEGQ